MSKRSDREAIIERLVASLRAERVRQGRSVYELSASSGLSHTMILRMEKGERFPTLDSLLCLTDALKVDLTVVLSAAIKSVRKSEGRARKK